MLLALVYGIIAIPELVAQTRSDTVVKTVTAPRYRGVATLVPEVAIGGASATAEEYQFGRVDEVLPLRDGSMIVVDPGTGTTPFVRVYSSAGRYLRTLGRAGEGPGEYTRPNGAAELGDGRILIRDARGGRISVFNSDGTSAQWLPAGNMNSTSMGPNYLTSAADGIVYLRLTIRSVPPGSGPPQMGFVRMRANGTIIDSVMHPVFPASSAPVLTATSPGSSRSTNVPFYPGTFSAFSPLGYFVTANTGRYAVDLRIPRSGASIWKEGDPVVSIRRTATAVAVNEAERAEHREVIEERMRSTQANWQWTGPEIPRTKTPITRVRVGLDGRIWVQLSTPSEKFDPATEPLSPTVSMGGGGRSGASGVVPTPTASRQVTWREPMLFDVFDPDGTYVGQVSVPFNTTVYATRGDHVWGLSRDRDGVETVHRFRIGWR